MCTLIIVAKFRCTIQYKHICVTMLRTYSFVQYVTHIVYVCYPYSFVQYVTHILSYSMLRIFFRTVCYAYSLRIVKNMRKGRFPVMRFFYVRLCTCAQYALMNEFTCSEHSVRIRIGKKKNASLENSLKGCFPVLRFFDLRIRTECSEHV